MLAREVPILLILAMVFIGFLVFIVFQTWENRQITRARMWCIIGAIAFALTLVAILFGAMASMTNWEFTKP